MMPTERSHNRSLLAMSSSSSSFPKEKESSMLRWLMHSDQRVSNACRFLGEYLKGHGQSLKKMYILLRKSLRQILRTKLDSNMKADIPGKLSLI